MASSEEEQIKAFNDLSKQAIDEYEELLKENEKIKKESLRLIEEKDNAIQQVEELRRVSQMVINEVDVIQSHLDIEKSCRETAEVLASKLNKDNKALKRISMHYMEKLGAGALPAELSLGEDSANDATNKQLDNNVICSSIECQNQIQDLRKNLASILEEKMQLSFQLENLKNLTDKLQKEEEKNKLLAAEIENQNQVLAKYNKVSMLALEEYEGLEQSLELEKDLRKEAESFAHEMLVEQKKLKRQSQILTQNMVPHEQLMKALDELAIVSGKMEQERILHEKKVKELEEQLNDSRFQKEVNSLKKQLKLFKEDKEELEVQCKKCDEQVRDLKHTIDELGKRIKRAEMSSLSPEPPLAPPLPPMSPSSDPLKNLMKILCKKQNESNWSEFGRSLSVESGNSFDEVKKQAVDEMMERIKKGVQLRKVNETNKTPINKNTLQESNALQELRGILKSHKEEILATSTKVKEENELQRILRHRKEVTESVASSSPHKLANTTKQSGAALRSGNKINRPPVQRKASKNGNT
ncbi:shootin-1 isoform X1 [Mobula hypostoma]|uniref:shootin-1 isoform X1 n=2 Tax=Mobula hypostoma TaxID=723540 RepID=UPI002FC353AA